MTEIEKPKPCPFCGKKPIIELGKKQGCQMHGEPRQEIVIACCCNHKPTVSTGDVYNGGRYRAEQKATILWNTRANDKRVNELEAENERLRKIILNLENKFSSRYFESIERKNKILMRRMIEFSKLEHRPTKMCALATLSSCEMLELKLPTEEPTE